MLLTVAQTVGLSMAAYVAWLLVKPYAVRTPLDNIPGPPCPSFITGHLGPFHDRHLGWDFNRTLLRGYSSVVRLRGLLGTNILYVSDPLALQQVLAHEGGSFGLSEVIHTLGELALGKGLVAVRGATHRRHRKMLNSVFTTESMRRVTPVVFEVTEQLRDTLVQMVQDGPQEIDVLHWISRASLELLAQGGFGHSFDLVASSSTAHPMLGAIKNLLPLIGKVALWLLGASYVRRWGSASLRRRIVNLLVAIVPDDNLGSLRSVIDTMDNTSREIFAARKAAFEDRDLPDRENIMGILLRANSESDGGSRLSDEELLGQINTILVAGVDTTSGSLARIIHTLATHPSAQDRLRRELDEARSRAGERISYDVLMQLPYLDAICRETLRLYPPVYGVMREVLSDTTIRLQMPVTGLDGTPMHQIHAPKGTVILPTSWFCNTAKEIWGEDALEWKPERWLSSLPDAVKEARIPGLFPNMMTFGAGERSCAGMRFALLELKVVLAVLFESFEFSLTGREVFWNLCPVIYPTMGKDEVEPSLVLTVSHRTQRTPHQD